MKKLFTLLLAIAGMVSTASATDYYIAGTYNGWAESFTAMTDNGDGTYSYSYPITSTTDEGFAFSTSNAGWSGFNSSRISPLSDNQTISVFGEYVTLNTGGSDSKSYQFTPKKYYNATYIITLDVKDVDSPKAKIDIDYSTCTVYVVGDLINQNWAANVGKSLTGSAGVFTGTVTVEEGNTGFCYTTNLGSDGGWTVTNTSRFKGWDDFNRTENLIMGTDEKNIMPAGTYNLTVDLNNETVSATIVSGYKYLTSSDAISWVEGGSLTESAGEYSATLPSMAGKYFVIIPDVTSLSGTTLSNWKYAIRPTAGSKEFTVYFQKYSSSTVSNKNGASDPLWKMDASNDAKVTIKYTPATGTYTIDQERSATIGAAGYATYSNGEKCTVSGADAIYVVDVNNTNSVHLNEMAASTVWPANEGMILKGSKDQVVTISAVASDASPSAIGTNYLVGSGNSTASITAGTGIYIFNWDGSNASSVGFYLANSGTLGAHKAYLDVSRATAREFLAFDFGEETGINATAMNHENMNDGATYNLSGQRVAQPTKGLYIVNGKKVVVK